MVMFGGTSTLRPGSLFGSTSNAGGGGVVTGTGTGLQQQQQQHNPMKDIEVNQPPDDSVQSLKFSHGNGPEVFLASGSWDNLVRVWEVKPNGITEPKAQQSAQGPVLSIDWSDDGSKIFFASADKTVRIWDLGSNQVANLGSHDQPIKTCNWIRSANYSCVMTGSWDKTLKFWDLRTPNTSMGTVQLQERVYCADVCGPMAVVGTAGRQVKVYKLDNQPSEVKHMESPLKFQHRCISIFKNKDTGLPTGFALGSIEGRVAIQYVDTQNPKDNFTFKCHRSPDLVNGFQDIYPVNDIAFHPVHHTLATVGSDGRFSYWDKDARTKLKTSEQLPSQITACAFSKGGEIFAYSSSYDWSKGHAFYRADQKNHIFVHPCMDELKPRPKK